MAKTYKTTKHSDLIQATRWVAENVETIPSRFKTYEDLAAAVSSAIMGYVNQAAARELCAQFGLDITNRGGVKSNNWHRDINRRLVRLENALADLLPPQGDGGAGA